MLNRGNTLHFVNRVDNSNCGDSVVCPLRYYFNYFKQYRIKRHDIRFIDIDSIFDGDVVIIGGGGLLDYSEFTNRAINKVLDTGAIVIAWSPGFNVHTEFSSAFETKINFERFALVTVRDYTNEYELDYLPDVTCKLPALREKYVIRREVGIAQHKDYPIEGFNYDIITNQSEIDEVLQFIGESKIVISNSFHMIYWAMLMGKKTICLNPFSSRFYSYQYKPAYFHTETDILSDCVEQAQTYQIIDEFIRVNDAFFERVKAIVECNLTPVTDDWLIYDFITQQALMTAKLGETQLQKGDLLASQLFIDVGEGFTEECKQIAINNVVGDEIHSVRYDLLPFSCIKALRFDPLEGQYCEVEILSAKTADGEISLSAQTSVRQGNRDRFLTTDPQYFIEGYCREYLEILFRLRKLNLFEAEQTTYSYVEKQSKTITYQSQQIQEQGETITCQSQQIQEQGEIITCQSQQIQEQGETITCQRQQIQEQGETITCQSQQIQEQGETITCHSQQIQEQGETITCQRQQIQEQGETITQQGAEIQLRLIQIETLHQSTCWKMTAPIRIVLDFIKRLLKGTN